MQWYTWLPWVLFGLTVIAVLLYFIFKPKNLSLEETKSKLKDLEELARTQKNDLIKERVLRVNAEKAQAKTELEFLESTYKKQLEDLSLEERRAYEKAKSNPKSGVDFINNLLK